MREWLTVIIALLILAVVLDGIRRVRQSRRNALRMPRRVARGGRDARSLEDDDFGSELPNGGARVVDVRRPDDAAERQGQIRQSRAKADNRKGTRIPQQVALNLDEHVPTLMEVEQQHASDAGAEQSSERPSRAGSGQRSKTSRITQDKLGLFDEHRIEPKLSAVDLDEDDPDVILGLVPERKGTQGEEGEQEWQADHHVLEKTESGQDAEEDFCEPELHEPVLSEPDLPEPDYREPEEVLVINVMAPKGERFSGDVLLDTVLEQGMRFGSMNIFHHHDHANGEGAVLYSMANIVVPGTFDLNAMREFETPGVSLFLALPLDADSTKAFESMLSTARAIASNLGGELKDENRSVLTTQTIEHYRSRIKEFERKQLSKAPL